METRISEGSDASARISEAQENLEATEEAQHARISELGLQSVCDGDHKIIRDVKSKIDEAGNNCRVTEETHVRHCHRRRVPETTKEGCAVP